MFDWLKRKPQLPVQNNPDEPKRAGMFSSDVPWGKRRELTIDEVNAIQFPRTGKDFLSRGDGGTMDDNSIKGQYNLAWQTIPEILLSWYAAQSFIGYQTCAILAQHWLIDKACSMPADDAARNGYEVTMNEGKKEVTVEIVAAIRELDKVYEINRNLIEFVRKGKIFGVRVAIFKVESSDPDYYLKPFNIDGVQPGSYRGIAQIDPFWITPELDSEAVGDPSSMHFYEPTWYRISGHRYHRTHLIVMRNGELSDTLKPVYFYGGIPLPQQLYERVYNAERLANEGPLLALTKRTDVLSVDASQLLANDTKVFAKIQDWVFNRDNYGIKIIDKESEGMAQLDTSLTDVDNVTMVQYQLVAAIAKVPATKLLGTTPKGFNSTGDYEEASYHEELKSIQTHWMSPLLERHHLLAIKSEIAPRFGIEPFEVEVVWNKLNETTEEQQAAINKLKSETATNYVNAGVTDGEDERERLVNDPNSGYNTLEENKIIEPDDTENDPDYFADKEPEDAEKAISAI